MTRRWIVADTTVPAREPRPGVSVFSKTVCHAEDGGDFPLGGIIVAADDRVDDETGELVAGWRIAEHWRGEIRYHHIDESDIDESQYDGAVVPHYCRSLTEAMTRDQMRGRHTRHLEAQLALSVAVQTRGAVS